VVTPRAPRRWLVRLAMPLPRFSDHPAQTDGPDNDAALFALCADGTIRRRYAFGGREWTEAPLPPGAKRVSCRAKPKPNGDAAAYEAASAVQRALGMELTSIQRDAIREALKAGANQ
jgi:hypothetical protein